VDQKTDELIKRIINEEFAEHTVIAIAHKLGMILDFDTIVLLDSGRIEEMGNPKQLLSTDSGFRKLYTTLKGSESGIVE
jgi:ATP-binding cassette, subfamily C (CFTR/MRP), member 1